MLLLLLTTMTTCPNPCSFLVQSHYGSRHHCDQNPYCCCHPLDQSCGCSCHLLVVVLVVVPAVLVSIKCAEWI